MLPWTPASPSKPSVFIQFWWIQIFNLLNGVSTFLVGWLGLRQALDFRTMLFNISVVWLSVGLVGALWTLGRLLSTGSIIAASHSLDIRFPTLRRHSGRLTVSPVENVIISSPSDEIMGTTNYYPLANDKVVEKPSGFDYAHPYGFTMVDTRPQGVVAQNSFGETFPNPEYALDSNKNAALLLSAESYCTSDQTGGGTPVEWRNQHSSFGSLDYTLAWLTVDDPYHLSGPSSVVEGSQNNLSETADAINNHPTTALPFLDCSDGTVGSASGRMAVESAIMILCAMLTAAGQFEFMVALGNVQPYYWGRLVSGSYAVCGSTGAFLYFLFILLFGRKRSCDIGAATMFILATLAVALLAVSSWENIVRYKTEVLHAITGASLLTLSGGLIVGVNQLGFSLYSLLLVRSLLMGLIGVITMLCLVMVHLFSTAKLQPDVFSVAIAAGTGVTKSLSVLVVGMAIDMGTWKVYGPFALLPAYGGLYVWPLTAFMGPVDLQPTFIIALLLIFIGMTPVVLRLEPEHRLRRFLLSRSHERRSESHVNTNA